MSLLKSLSVIAGFAFGAVLLLALIVVCWSIHWFLGLCVLGLVNTFVLPEELLK